jgi:hypothetical protein
MKTGRTPGFAEWLYLCIKLELGKLCLPRAPNAMHQKLAALMISGTALLRRQLN